MATLPDSYRGLALAACILAIALLASARGYLEFINGAVQDWISALPIRAASASTSPVVLIEFDAIGFHDDDSTWSELLPRLTASRPRQIVLLERPSRLAPATYRVIAASADLVGVLDSPWVLPEAPTLAGLQAARNRPTADYGVFRRLSLQLPSAARARGAGEHVLLVKAAENHTGYAPVIDEVRPNFVTGSGKPPRIRATRIARGEVTDDLLVGKSLVLAPAARASDAPIFTPGGKSGVTDSAAFQAQALHALLTSRHVADVPLPVVLLGMLLLALACLYFFQRAGLALSLYFTVGAAFVGLVISTVSLHFADTAFPLAEILITVLGMWVAVLNRKYVAEQEGMLRELNSIAELMQKRLVPADVLHSEGYWEKIAYMVQRLLQLDRSIFLETLPDERRVQEIYAVNCDLSDIDERRRDYERTPYTTALKARQPITVERYLKDAGEWEQQYLVPLQVEGKVLGFWAFGIDPKHLAPLAEKLEIIGQFADDISELLYQRQQLRERDHQERRRWLDYLTLQGGRSLARDLKAALAVTTRRLRVVEDLFENSDTAYLLYDTFGQLLLDNQAAGRLCDAYGIEAYELSYTDTLSRLSGLDLEDAKTRLQRVMIDGESVALALRPSEVVSADGSLQSGALKLSRLLDSGSADGTSAPSAFAVSGLVIEIWMAGQSAAHGAVPNWVRRVLAIEAARGGAMLAGNALAFLDAVDPSRAEDGELANLGEAIDRARTQHAALIRKKRLDVDVDAATTAVTPLLPDRLLDEVLTELLQFALEDAKRGSTVRLRIVCAEPELELRIETDGIGVAAPDIAHMLDSGRDNGSSSTLLPCSTSVHRFGGSLEIASEVGKSTSIALRIPALPESKTS